MVLPLVGDTPPAAYRYIRRVHLKQRQAISVISLWLADSIFGLSPSRFRQELVVPALLHLARDQIAKATQTLTVSTAGPAPALLHGLAGWPGRRGTGTDCKFSEWHCPHRLRRRR
jgi:hypothetical protein